AENVGRRLVERRLAACVNILPGMVSHYWWQGAIERGEEVVMIIKTRASLVEKLSETVKQAHAYTTPAIIVLPIEGAIRTIWAGCWRRRKGLRRPSWRTGKRTSVGR